MKWYFAVYGIFILVVFDYTPLNLHYKCNTKPVFDKLVGRKDKLFSSWTASPNLLTQIIKQTIRMHICKHPFKHVLCWFSGMVFDSLELNSTCDYNYKKQMFSEDEKLCLCLHVYLDLFNGFSGLFCWKRSNKFFDVFLARVAIGMED